MRSKQLFVVLALVVLVVAAAPAHAGGAVDACDEDSLRTALSGGGLVTFTCSGTITLTETITITSNTTVDGTGQAVTISGNNAVQVFYVGTPVTLNL